MSRIINLSTPNGGVVNGMTISFKTPCDCNDVTGVSLEGTTYAFVDSSAQPLSGCSSMFDSGAILSVIIDTTNNTATILNPLENNFTKGLAAGVSTAVDEAIAAMDTASQALNVANETSTAMSGIIEGTTVVAKATRDGDGKVIPSYHGDWIQFSPDTDHPFVPGKTYELHLVGFYSCAVTFTRVFAETQSVWTGVLFGNADTTTRVTVSDTNGIFFHKLGVYMENGIPHLDWSQILNPSVIGYYRVVAENN